MSQTLATESLALDKASLLRMCKGDPSRLPTFRVHSNEAWPWPAFASKGCINIRESSFQRIVMENALPVRPGLWVSMDCREFSIDLRADQLQGSSDRIEPDAGNHDVARQVARVDEAGRRPHEPDYGAPVVEPRARREVDPDDLARIAADPERGSVRSTTVDGGGDTERDLAMGDHD